MTKDSDMLPMLIALEEFADYPDPLGHYLFSLCCTLATEYDNLLSLRPKLYEEPALRGPPTHDELIGAARALAQKDLHIDIDDGDAMMIHLDLMVRSIVMKRSEPIVGELMRTQGHQMAAALTKKGPHVVTYLEDQNAFLAERKKEGE